MLNTVHAETLSDADREALLDSLEQLREAADSKVDARFRVALAAYRNAIGSDDSAIELYLNCMEKVNFKDLHKKDSEFRDWKRKEAEKLSEPGLRLAIRHQLRWLMLTLEAASPKADKVKLAADAQEAVDAIFRDADKLEYQQQILSQSVTSSVFAQAYDINNVKVEKWSLSPINIDSIYEDTLLPPYRRPGSLATLRAGWIKRIQQETVKMELWSSKRPDRENRDEKQRIGMAEDMLKTPEYLQFIEQEVPKLQWDMEMDMFLYGDESGAAARMLAHLQKYLAHPSAKEWSNQLEKLLKPIAPPAAPGAPAAPPVAADAAP